MQGIAQFFEYGGMPMYLLLLSGGVGLVLITLQLILVKRVTLRPLILGNIAGTLLLGGMGTLWGFTQIFAAISAADPAKKQEMAAAGIAEALNCSIFGVVLAGLLLLLGAVALTLRSNLKQPAER